MTAPAAHPLRVAAAALWRVPSLWPTALRQGWRAVPRRWWARRPYLPVPSADYLRFRLETQYGHRGGVEGEDVVTFLRWCRDADR
jgi:hypothetical protein